MDDLLTPVSDTVPAFVEGAEVAAANGAESKPSSSKAMIVFEKAVSYTHLTLPTNSRV